MLKLYWDRYLAPVLGFEVMTSEYKLYFASDGVKLTRRSRSTGYRQTIFLVFWYIQINY